jgi:hypothetical protein
MHRATLRTKRRERSGTVVAVAIGMHRLLSAFPLVLVTICGCSSEDSNGAKNPGTGGQSTGGTSSGGSGNTTSGGSGGSIGGSGGSATGGAAGSPSTGGSAGSTAGTGGVAPGPDIENIDGQNITAFPAHLGFDTNDYDDVHGFVWTTDGATHEHAPTAGWSGGAAHFTPPTQEGYSGIGQFHFAAGVAPTHLSMRWLMKTGPTMGQYGSGNKTILFVRNPNDAQHHRPMIITRPDPAHPDAFVPGACDGTVCQYKVAPGNQEPFWPDGNDTFWLSPSGYAEEWVSWEFEADANAGWIRLYITTQDGVFNDTLYVENPMVDSQTGGTFDYIDILGGYFGACQADPGNWFELDEVVIHNQHIGPPPGFVTP